MTKTKKQKIFLLTLTAFMCLIAFLFSSVGYTPKVFADGGEETQTQTEGETAYLDGLGEGINLITANDLTDYVSGFRVLKINSLQSLPKSRYELDNSEQGAMITTNASELLSNYQSTFDFSVGVDSFLTKLRGTLSLSNNTNIIDHKYKFYYSSYMNLYNYRYELQYYRNPNTYVNAFTDDFSSDIEAFKNGNSTLTYEEFFAKYGTHLIGSAIYGGKIFTTYSIYSNNIIFEKVNNSQLGVELQTPIPNTDVLANVLAKYNNKYYSNYTQDDATVVCKINRTGGLPTDFGSLDQLRQNYQTWLNSFIGSTVQETQEKVNEYSKLVDFTSNGLVGLWDILPDGYDEVAVEMEEAFLQLSEAQKQEFEEDYSSVEVGEFSGGTGASNNPYVITVPEQLRHIENHMTSHYKLANDMNLTKFNNWQPIGGYYKEKAFTGTFDGCNYNINGLSRTSAKSVSNHRLYFGLFGYVGTGGVLKNVNFTNIAISLGVDGYNKKDRTFTGVVCGVITGGTIENVTTVSGYVINSNNCTGIVYVGGIAGLANNSIIRNCTNNIQVTGGRYTGVAGGIAGCGYNTQFVNCINNGSIIGYGTNGGYAIAGGILGVQNNTSAGNCYFSNCTNTGSTDVSKPWSSLLGITKKKGSLYGWTTSEAYL